MSYINKRYKLFEERPRSGLVPVRSEARIKSYDSATDARAWSDIVEERRQHILEYNALNKAGCIDKLIPLEILFDALMANKNLQARKLRHRIEYLQKKLDIYNKLELACDQRRMLRRLRKELDERYSEMPPVEAHLEVPPHDRQRKLDERPEAKLKKRNKKDGSEDAKSKSQKRRSPPTSDSSGEEGLKFKPHIKRRPGPKGATKEPSKTDQTGRGKAGRQTTEKRRQVRSEFPGRDGGKDEAPIEGENGVGVRGGPGAKSGRDSSAATTITGHRPKSAPGRSTGGRRLRGETADEEGDTRPVRRRGIGESTDEYRDSDAEVNRTKPPAEDRPKSGQKAGARPQREAKTIALPEGQHDRDAEAGRGKEARPKSAAVGRADEEGVTKPGKKKDTGRPTAVTKAGESSDEHGDAEPRIKRGAGPGAGAKPKGGAAGKSRARPETIDERGTEPREKKAKLKVANEGKPGGSADEEGAVRSAHTQETAEPDRRKKPGAGAGATPEGTDREGDIKSVVRKGADPGAGGKPEGAAGAGTGSGGIAPEGAKAGEPRAGGAHAEKDAIPEGKKGAGAAARLKGAAEGKSKEKEDTGSSPARFSEDPLGGSKRRAQAGEDHAKPVTRKGTAAGAEEKPDGTTGGAPSYDKDSVGGREGNNDDVAPAKRKLPELVL
ncbi:unnamed protein product [Acanthoscelides obtectus]|uniref:Uncharacterized protein n=1 Tax=Acanthoscelides obtectus TaxID=200917 RepID=A0A9P0JTR8_ACAOB|nr:unnamed protein product [Acanthoscelides obtectus]CAK1667289.1 hypothetical protein AOBTE_LOCUS25763 [Acanthoscelides obtectus]